MRAKAAVSMCVKQGLYKRKNSPRQESQNPIWPQATVFHICGCEMIFSLDQISSFRLYSGNHTLYRRSKCRRHTASHVRLHQLKRPTDTSPFEFQKSSEPPVTIQRPMKHSGPQTFSNCHRLIGTVIVHNDDLFRKITTLQTFANIALFVMRQQTNTDR